MNNQTYFDFVSKHREKILEVERYIWQHPESGFKEWNTSKYLAKIFEDAGYTLTYAGDIPGFYTDIDTGKPGPKILIMGELDALVAPTHREAWNNCAHACGHNAQCAGLVGIALALKEPGALDGLCGSIRLMAVPAEELIEIEYRDSLRQQGLIHYLGGKVEFMYRGYMDDVDISFMFHTGRSEDHVFDCNKGANGCMAKEITYKGVASHAGGSPHNGINAMYAATLGLQAINSLRETFRDEDKIRVHPIMEANGSAVNIIPAKATVSTFVRGTSMDAIIAANKKVTRALASGALAMGAEVTVSDRPGYAPLLNSPELMEVAKECMIAVAGEDKVKFDDKMGGGSTDMGDLSTVIPSMHPHVSGAAGTGHGDDYAIVDPDTACVKSAQCQVLMAAELLKNNAEKARYVIDNFKPVYPSIKAYFEAVDQLMSDRSLVTYTDEGAQIVF